MQYDYQTICPFCFRVYQPGDMDDDYPMCRDCNLEGRSIMVDGLDSFTSQIDLSELTSLKTEWTRREDFVVIQRNRILSNLDQLIGSIRDRK
jgi:hypothetical protein